MDRPVNVLADYVLRGVFAKSIKVSDRTVARYENEPNGLPHLYIGGRDYVHIPSAREWLARRLKRPNPRPAKSRRAA